MARFFGKVGYGQQGESAPSVYRDIITERPYYGDITRESRGLSQGESLNKDVTVSNMISILADSYANEHIFAIRYVEYAGALWTVTEAEVQSPRILLRLGGVYNGPTPNS